MAAKDSEINEDSKTPEDQKALALVIRRYLRADWDEAVKNVATDLSQHKAFVADEFTKVNEKFSQHKREIEINRKTINKLKEGVDDFTEQSTHIIEQHENEIRALDERLSKHEVVTKKIVSEQVKIQIQAEMASRGADIEALRKKFSKIQFSENEKPTDLDLYDFKVFFKKSEKGVGLCPITRTDLQEIMRRSNVSLEDAFRVAASEYLRYEMKFTTAFVKNLERYLVCYIWDKKNTLYLVVTDVTASGLKRIRQESWVLWKHRVDGQQTRELRRLEVPQFRDRYRAMEDYCDQLRFAWKQENPSLWAAGKKRRTRILETDEYDYIIQVKEWDQKIYGPQAHVVPEEISNLWPKINFKMKSYIQYEQQYYKPEGRDQVGDRDTAPAGRKRNEQPVNNQEEEGLGDGHHVSVIDPNYSFVPGMVRPTSSTASDLASTRTNLQSLEMASHLASRTPENEVPELNGGVGTDNPPNWTDPQAPAGVKDFAAKQQARADRRAELDRQKQQQLEQQLAEEHRQKLAITEAEQIKRDEALARELAKEDPKLVDISAGNDSVNKQQKDSGENKSGEEKKNEDMQVDDQPPAEYVQKQGATAASPSEERHLLDLDPEDTFYLWSQKGGTGPKIPDRILGQQISATSSNASTAPPPAKKAKPPTLLEKTFVDARKQLAEQYGVSLNDQILAGGENLDIRQPDQLNPDLRRPNVIHVGGRVRVDDRLIANVDEFDSNGNPPNFHSAQYFGPGGPDITKKPPVSTPSKGAISKYLVKQPPPGRKASQSSAEPPKTPAINSTAVTAKTNDPPTQEQQNPANSTASQEQQISDHNIFDVTNPDDTVRPLIELTPAAPAGRSRKKTVSVADESEVDFETADEGEEEEDNDATLLLSPQEEKKSGNDTILTPALLETNPGRHIEALNMMQSTMDSFVYKPQSTLASQMCDHTSVNETASQPPPPSSPPLNVSKPGQQSYPSPSSNASPARPAASFGEIYNGKGWLKKMVGDATGKSTPNKSLRSLKLKEKIDAAKLKAGTATKVGRPITDLPPPPPQSEPRPAAKRTEPESGFMASSVNKDMRTVSPEQPTKVVIVREHNEPQGHEIFIPPSPEPDSTGAITDVILSTPGNHKQHKSVMEELKGVVKDVVLDSAASVEPAEQTPVDPEAVNKTDEENRVKKE